MQGVQDGSVTPNDAVDQLRHLPFEDLGFASLDHHRELRTGFPEVVYGPGKTTEQIVTIFESLAAQADQVMVTRVDEAVYDAVRQRIPEAAFNPIARAVYLDRRTTTLKPGVTVVSAGTADQNVAEEAALTAQLLGNDVQRFTDVGVSGIHRLLDKLEALREARAIVAVAGMEGALPTVVAGLVRAPVIAVPTSVGYGASFQGVAALLAMLNSCASGIAVVNIDNGFGAGYMAGTINQQS